MSNAKLMLTCKDPTAALSNPYCIFAIETTQHMRRHLRFVHKEVSVTVIATGILNWMELPVVLVA
jgi:hypothetical protein